LPKQKIHHARAHGLKHSRWRRGVGLAVRGVRCERIWTGWVVHGLMLFEHIFEYKKFRSPTEIMVSSPSL
jgi:hypothetical protein